MEPSLSSRPRSVFLGCMGVVVLGVISFSIVGGFFLLRANIHYHVVEEYVFFRGGDAAIIYLGVMLPKSGPYQSVENVEISFDGFQEVQDHGSVEIVRFSGEKSAQENLSVLIEYDVKLPKKKIAWILPVEDFQRLPQSGIESDCKCILEKAESLGVGVSGQDAFEIYTFTNEYLTYSRGDMDCPDMSAAIALKDRECNCAGYSRIMTALCRASGIPAQMVVGLVYPDPMLLSQLSSFPDNPDEAHAWVEYYSEGRWKMADPTLSKKYLEFMQFDRNDGRHLVYGEHDKVFSAAGSMRAWAFEQGDYLLGGNASIRYVATSDLEKILFSPAVKIERKWDGRWLNALIVTVGVTWIFHRFSEKLLSALKYKS